MLLSLTPLAEFLATSTTKLSQPRSSASHEAEEEEWRSEDEGGEEEEEEEEESLGLCHAQRGRATRGQGVGYLLLGSTWFHIEWLFGGQFQEHKVMLWKRMTVGCLTITIGPIGYLVSVGVG